jgi:hypothetical protein
MRSIRNSVEQPSAAVYFAVAATSALVVLAVAGYAARPASPQVEAASASPVSALVPSVEHESAVDSTGARASGLAQVVSVLLEGDTIVPDEIHISAGRPARLVITGESSCASSISFSAFDSRTVTYGDGRCEVLVPALTAGTYPFSCDSHLISGSVVAK